MGSIIIKLNPQKLTNPDLDLRYLIPDKIEEATNGKVTDNGYDYLDDSEKSIAIFLKSSDPKTDVENVLDILKGNTFLDNNIYETSDIYTSDIDNADISDSKIVRQSD